MDRPSTPPIAGQVVGRSARVCCSRPSALGRCRIALRRARADGVALSPAGPAASPRPGRPSSASDPVGFMGTVSGIGGPPIALVYQHSDGPTLRGTLARYFTVGNLVAIPTLVVAGHLGRDELLPIAVLVPGALAGLPSLQRWLAVPPRQARRLARSSSGCRPPPPSPCSCERSPEYGRRMTDEQPIETVRRFCAAWGTKDLDDDRRVLHRRRRVPQHPAGAGGRARTRSRPPSRASAVASSRSSSASTPSPPTAARCSPSASTSSPSPTAASSCR